MTGKFSAWCKSTAPVLFEPQMPVWLTMVASILAAIGAYYVSPIVNRQFQVNQSRSEHLSKTTSNLNDEIISLSTKVRRLNEALVNRSDKAPDIRGDCLDLTTKLQWMLVDLKVVLVSPQDRAAVDELARALTDVKAALDVAVDARAEPRLLQSMEALGSKTQIVIDRLYVKASLK